MRYLSNILALTTITILLFVPFFSNSREFQQNELTQAIQFFDKKQYSEAEKRFEKLLKERPNDFMINYFYGACRTENGHYSDRDLAYLLKASKEVSPLDIDYYFGVQYQAKEDWENALFHYETFGKTADDAEQKRVNLAKKIEQCKNHVNPFTRETETANDSIVESEPIISAISNTENSDSVKVSQPEIAEKDTTDTIQIVNNTEEVNNDQTNEPNPVINISPSKPAEPKDLPVEFSINSEIIYKKLSDFRTQEGKQFFEQGNSKQKELETVLGTTKNLRSMYSSATFRNVKDSLGQRILGLENRSLELKNEINQFYSESKQAENEFWSKATEDEKATFLALQNTPERQDTELPSAKEDTSALEIPEILVDKNVPNMKPTKPANDDLLYKIQIGAYSRGLPISIKKLFDKLSLIRKIENYTDDKGVVVYTTGNLKKLDDAMVLLKQLQQEGVEDAIIAAYFKGKRIPLTEAKELEGIK